MFPTSAFDGMYETVDVYREVVVSFSKGKVSKINDLITERLRIVVQPISLGRVLKVLPDADKTATYYKFHQKAQTGIVPIAVGDVIVRSDGDGYFVKSVMDWTQHGAYISGMMSFEKNAGKNIYETIVMP